jgi:thermitase
LKALKQVISAERNQRAVELELKPNDTYFDPQQWNMDNYGQFEGSPDADIDAPEAWQYTTGDNSVTLGIVEHPVDATHPDFGDKVFGDLNQPQSDHATHVAGIMAAVGNNGQGVAGVDWKARICTQDYGNSAGIEEAAQAIIDAADAGSAAINCSWCMDDDDPDSYIIYNACTYALQMGALVVAGIPEEPNKEFFEMPSGFGPWILSVNATDINDDGVPPVAWTPVKAGVA